MPTPIQILKDMLLYHLGVVTQILHVHKKIKQKKIERAVCQHYSYFLSYLTTLTEILFEIG